MLLVVDVGNTNTVLGLYDGTELVHDFRIESAKGRMADEYLVLFISLINLAGVSRERVTASIVASVVPALSDPINAALRRAFGHKPLVVGPGIKTGMPILYENPREVGADRIVNAIAAFERAVDGQGCIVVDFGTATTFDCV
jgi:type III pantothenate kinase